MLGMKAILKEIVAIPSVSGEEEKLAIFVARFCRQMGHEVYVINGSIAARIRGTVSWRALIYNGHLDTVPGDWPGVLELKVQGASLEGLGVTDMKGGLAVMLQKAQSYRFVPPPCDIWLFFSKEEETTAQGSLDLAAWWTQNFVGRYMQKAVVILEPTDNKYLAFSHKGGGVFKTVVRGPEFHGSTHLDGVVTAPKLACDFGIALTKIQKSWLRHGDDHGVSTINLTGLSGYTGGNMVPEAVRLWVDVRTNAVTNTKRLEAVLARLNKRFGTDLHLDSMRHAGVVKSASTEPLDQAFSVGWPGLPRKTFPAATDMTAFIQRGLSVCIFGPGMYEQAHKRHEKIREGALEECFWGLKAVERAFAYC